VEVTHRETLEGRTKPLRGPVRMPAAEAGGIQKKKACLLHGKLKRESEKER